MPAHASGSFFDTWDTYQKVVAGDHMFHREIGAALSQVLRARFGSRPFSIFDLGCGDAATLTPFLEGLSLQRYKGVDLSETALTLAAENLKALACPVDLAHADILAALAAEIIPFDVIYSSFALHHLRTAQKAEFFNRVATKLNKGGLLLLVDVVREEDETLDVYHERYCEWLRRSFSALNGDEKDLICDHIVNNDLPEPLSVLQAQARAAGLKIALSGTRFGWHWVLSFASA
jgi:SAM-dependent methyltransferase